MTGYGKRAEIYPPFSHVLRKIERQVASVFESWGYSEVIPPPFERFEDYTRASGGNVSDTYRFLDWRTGELMVFRSDFTPQVVTLLSRMKGDKKRTLRLYYSGQVLRQSEEELFFYQSGCEIFTRSSKLATFEPVVMCGDVFQNITERKTVLSLNHSEILRSLLGESAHLKTFGELKEALLRRDAVEVESILKAAGVAGGVRKAVSHLSRMFGEVQEVKKNSSSLAHTPAEVYLKEIFKLARLARETGLFSEVFIDLADVRYQYYHSGVVFSVYVDGLPRPAALGGRYDRLLRDLGLNYRAGGFGINISMMAEISKAVQLEEPEVITFSSASRMLEAFKIAKDMRGRGKKVALEED